MPPSIITQLSHFNSCPPSATPNINELQLNPTYTAQWQYSAMRLGDRKFCVDLCRRLECLQHRERQKGKNSYPPSQFCSPGQLSPSHENRVWGGVSSSVGSSPDGFKLIWNSVLSPNLRWSLVSSKGAIHWGKFQSMDLCHFKIQNFPFQRLLSCFLRSGSLYVLRYKIEFCRCQCFSVVLICWDPSNLSNIAA